MAIFNLGSINIDFVYGLDDMPRPGETLAAHSFTKGLGGKGTNQSIAISRAGGHVHHIGAINDQDGWTVDEMRDTGVNVDHVLHVATPTGHAIIYIDQHAENEIVLYQGANWQLTEAQVDRALDGSAAGDWLLLQNETNLGHYAARSARERGLKVCYSAAPFDLELVAKVIEFTDLLVVNEIEFQQAQDLDLSGWSGATLVTHGAKGAVYLDQGDEVKVAAYATVAVDTTGAGDTFLGYALAAIDRGDDVKTAMQQAAAAAAIQVSRHGAAGAIPTMAETQKFMKDAR